MCISISLPCELSSHRVMFLYRGSVKQMAKTSKVDEGLICAAFARQRKMVDGFSTRTLQGYLAHKNPPPPKEPTMALCLGTYGDPMGMVVSHERGTPVPFSRSRASPLLMPDRPPCTPPQGEHACSVHPQGIHRGTSPIRKRLPPLDPPRTLGMGLR